MPFPFSRLLLSNRAADLPWGRSIRDGILARGLEVERREEGTLDAHPWARRPRTLIVQSWPGSGWVRRAEHGTLSVRPDEYYIDAVLGCSAHCTYCYLQALPQGRRPIRFNVDVDSLVAELRQVPTTAGKVNIFCTGELADSLLDAELFPIARILAEEFSRGDLGRLELRTKGGDVGSLLDVRHRGRTTVAFSLSPVAQLDGHEQGTAEIKDRLRAAKAASEAGYPIALKFEPFLIRAGWQEAYGRLLTDLATIVQTPAIEHFTIGSLRWSERLGSLKSFRTLFRHEIGKHDLVEYRPGIFNAMPARSIRVSAYGELVKMIRYHGFDAEILWSLEEPDVMSVLSELAATTTHQE